MAPTTRPRDPFLERLVQRTALRAHDAEAVYEATLARSPEVPRIADYDRLTADEHAAIDDCVAAYGAYEDQRLAAKAELADARSAHADAYRLATGHELGISGAAVMAYGVMKNGPLWALPENAPAMPPLPPVDQIAPRTAPRARGAGRPAARATRSSAASGDSGSDDPPGEPAGEPEQLEIPGADIAGRLSRIAARLRSKGGQG